MRTFTVIYLILFQCAVLPFVVGAAFAEDGLRTGSESTATRREEAPGSGKVQYQSDAQVSQQVRSSRESEEATQAALSLNRQTNVFGYGILRIPRE